MKGLKNPQRIWRREKEQYREEEHIDAQNCRKRSQNFG